MLLSTELQESTNITTIALPDGSLATLRDFSSSSGQIILTGDNHSQLIEQNGQLAIVTNPEGIAQVAMVTDQGELNTEFALVTEGENVTMVTQDGTMLAEMMDASDDPPIMEDSLDNENVFAGDEEESQVVDS